MVELDTVDTKDTAYRILLIEGYDDQIEQLTPVGPEFAELAQAEAYYDEHELWRGAWGSRNDRREYRIVEVRAREQGRIYYADGQVPYQTGQPVTQDRGRRDTPLRIWLENDALCWEALPPKLWN